jgi:hypothetical protein
MILKEREMWEDEDMNDQFQNSEQGNRLGAFNTSVAS